MSDKKKAVTPLDAIAAVQELPLEFAWVAEVADIVGSSGRHAKRFTGGRLARGDPEKYDRIVRLRSLGMSVRNVADVERVSPQTVTAIMRIEEGSRTAEEYRGEVSADMGVGVRLAMDALIEKLADPKVMAKTPVRDLAMAMEKISQQRELLSGGATHRSEAVQSEEARREEAERHAKDVRDLYAAGAIVDIGEPPYGGEKEGGLECRE